jgi:DNA-binding MarR family transcriptional regulator
LLGSDTRIDILFDVLAHPEHTPSLVELDHSMQYTDALTLRMEVDKMVEYGLLERVRYDGEDAAEYETVTFYTLTDGGWATIRFFNDIFTPDVYERLSDVYEQVIDEAPESVRNATQSPRPSPSTDDS